MGKLIRSSMILILMGIYGLAGTTVFGGDLFGDNSMVRQKCSACHKPDTNGRLEVIEETRKSTEEWKVVVDRMIRLNSAPLADEDFYPVIKELSQSLCLTPEESGEIAYLNSDENSQYREIPKNDLETRIYTACVRCHTYGKIASHKMTKDQWKENRNLHLGYYPTVIPQMREMDWFKESEALIDPLTKLFPFDTDAYKQWLENRKDQDLAGSWNVAGYQPGMGYYHGVYTIEPNMAKGEDEYIIEKKVTYESGLVVSTQGEGTLFSEYHLRYALAPTPLTGRVEGVFDLDAAWLDFVQSDGILLLVAVAIEQIVVMKVALPAWWLLNSLPLHCVVPAVEAVLTSRYRDETALVVEMNLDSAAHLQRANYHIAVALVELLNSQQIHHSADKVIYDRKVGEG